ncbi:plasmid replication protein, CyRepA1 family [Coleofasciculus sp. FACHB-SPT9]|uniref:plasmid replication protein, CyRepA1 family n=1 Tax=Cyanophyceae TaxID=3028117 RepID=UPI00168854FD|nr:DUF3854 domain-containing protein [Coleofasciculus sp. FACHB-SPT9]
MLLDRHLEELEASKIDADIIRLNFKSVRDNEPYEYLFYSPAVPRRNDGRLRDRVLKNYRHIEAGGWVCVGRDPLINWREQEWCTFKPDKPRRAQDGKLIKYEHPYRTPTRAIFVKVPLHIMQLVSEHCNIPMPEKVEVSPSGEVKIFWQWVLDSNVPIVITEGVKKAAALLTAGEAAIAIPGVSSGFRTPKDENGTLTGNCHLIPELEIFATPDRQINICFDQDEKPQTVATVGAMIAKTGRLFAFAQSVVKVITWNGMLGKGVDDLIALHGVERFYTAYDQATSLEKWEARQYFQLTYKPSLQVNRRYLGELPIPDGAKLVALKSPKGTGKTQTLAHLAQKATYLGQKVLVITHRTQLGGELCYRFGIDYISELRDSETKGVLGQGMCIDSLHSGSSAKFNVHEWKNCLIFIDEVEQLIAHLLNGSTCQKNRVVILQNLKTLIQQNLSSESTGQVFLSDADLSNVSIDFIKGLAEFQVNPFIVVNEWKAQDGGRHCYQHGGKNPSELIAALEADMENGGIPLIVLSAQKEQSTWGTINIESRLKALYPERKGLRIDSESVSDPSHPAYGCVGNLNEILSEYDYVICSPTLETGISIDIKGHFTGVWGIFQGVCAPASALQALVRLREGVDIHFWASRVGMNGCRIGNGSSSVKSLLASQHTATKVNIFLLQRAGFDFEDIDTNFQNESLRAWAKLAARHNAAMCNYADNIVEGLKADGHTIIPLDETGKGKEIKEEIKLNRDTNYQREGEAIADAPDISSGEYEKLSNKINKTKAERQTERKHSLKLRYAVEEITSSLVQMDDKKLYPKLRLHYFLNVGKEYLSDHDQKSAAAATEAKALWKPDFNRAQMGLKVLVLQRLGIEKFLLEEGREFRNGDEDLESLASTAIAQRGRIRTALGISIRLEDSSVVVLRKLMSCLGIKLKPLGRDGQGERKRFYGLDVSPEHSEIFQAWLERDLAAASTTSNKEINKPEVDRKLMDAPPSDVEVAPSTVSNQEMNKPEVDEKTEKNSLHSFEVAARSGVAAVVENAVRTLRLVKTPEQVTAVFDRLKRFPQGIKGEIWASVPDTRKQQLLKMEKDGRRIAELPSHLKMEIIEGQRRLLAAPMTEILSTLDYFSNIYEGWYSDEEIRQIRDGIWLGLAEEEKVRISIKRKIASETQSSAASRKSFWGANHAPKPSFTPGQRVRFEGKIYTVIGSTHSHSQLKGIDKAIVNSDLKPLEQETDRAAIAFV